jgi:hypothetical protein
VQHSVGSDWESLAQRRKISSMCALYKALPMGGLEKRECIGYRRQATLGGLIDIGNSEPGNKEDSSGNTHL